MSALPKSDAELARIVEDLEAAAYLKRYGGQYRFFRPHPKQREHLDLGSTKRERLLMAGNRLGKSETGAFEASIHLSGKYPKDWKGRRFDAPTKGWIVGVTWLDVRNVCQTKLCGQYGVEEAFGSGMIPKDAIIDKSLGRNVTDAYDTIQVRHVSGGVSVAQFKSQDQGRAKFQGESLDWIWFDEEPPEDIYAEGLTRIGERDGICWLTFTPLLGWSSVVNRFLNEPSGDRGVTTITIDEAPHLSPEVKQRMISGYLAHEREARARGVPMLGSGRIFLTPESSLVEDMIERIPPHWGKLWGMDFGIGHPFAAVLAAWDRDEDVIHILHTIRMANALSLVHAATMLRVGAAVPVAWPRDGLDRDSHTGEPLAHGYRKLKLKMLHEHAQWEDGGMSTEAGIQEWDERERTGRLRVAAHLADWFEERRFYHRKDGKIVKIKDDIMSATRMIFMMKRYARNVALGGEATLIAGPSPNGPPRPADLIDPWSGQ